MSRFNFEETDGQKFDLELGKLMVKVESWLSQKLEIESELLRAAEDIDDRTDRVIDALQGAIEESTPKMKICGYR